MARSIIIAEAGTSHLGSVRAAKELAAFAQSCGADVVKFQVFDDPNPQTMFCWMKGDNERVVRWRKSRMPLYDWAEVYGFCKSIGISLMFSCFEHTTIGWQNSLNLPVAKVASRAAQTYPYWESTAQFFIYSTGMTRHVCAPKGKSVLMECKAVYPSEKRWTGKHPGYSCHSAHPFLAIEAISKGCRMVEVHFCRLKSEAGPDEEVSMTPDQLALICKARDYYDELSA